MNFESFYDYNKTDILLALNFYKEQSLQMCETIDKLDYRIYEAKEHKPIITVYRSKPIKGIVLELQSFNPKYMEDK